MPLDHYIFSSQNFSAFANTTWFLTQGNSWVYLQSSKTHMHSRIKFSFIDSFCRVVEGALRYEKSEVGGKRIPLFSTSGDNDRFVIVKNAWPMTSTITPRVAKPRVDKLSRNTDCRSRILLVPSSPTVQSAYREIISHCSVAVGHWLGNIQAFPTSWNNNSNAFLLNIPRRRCNSFFGTSSVGQSLV